MRSSLLLVLSTLARRAAASPAFQAIDVRLNA